MLASGPQYLGDFPLAAVFNLKFTTFASTGAPTVLAGTPAISIYKDGNNTETTTGISLTVDFDGIVGLNDVAIDTSNAFYAAGSTFTVVITTGTVSAVSVVGYVVGSFSINARSALRPTTASRTLDVSATGEAGLDWANIGSPTTAVDLSGTSTKALEPTTAGRKLDVSTGGEAGLDWANIGSPTTVQNLSGTTSLGAAATLSSAERNAIADALLDRNMATGTDSGSPTVRTPRQSFRALRNKVSIGGSTLVVTKEDDATPSWSAAVTTDAAALPVTGVDPA